MRTVHSEKWGEEMAKNVYMEVTKDDLSLPLAIADTAQELARLRGVNALQVLQGASRAHKMRKPRWVKVELEEDEG